MIRCYSVLDFYRIGYKNVVSSHSIARGQKVLTIIEHLTEKITFITDIILNQEIYKEDKKLDLYSCELGERFRCIYATVVIAFKQSHFNTCSLYTGVL